MIKGIDEYGYTDFFKEQVEKLNLSELVPARVIEIQKEKYKIVKNAEIKNATLKGSKFYDDLLNKNFPVIGDFVLVKSNPMGDDVVYDVLKRKSNFSRFDSHYGVEEIVAANFDYVFIVTSLNNDFNMKRIDRYVSISWQSGATPVIVLTKSDIYPNYLDFKLKIENNFIGVDVLVISSVTRFGFEELPKYMKPQKSIVLLGSSGVGKSSLLNAIAGDNIMKTNYVRENDAKGRHTTTHRQLILLENGSMIIDTPGMRTLGVGACASDGIDITFSEIEDLILMCKFKNCTHDKEPGCAIKEAIENGTLSLERWNNYLKLKKEAKFCKAKERRKARTLEKESKGKKLNTKYNNLIEYDID